MISYDLLADSSCDLDGTFLASLDVQCMNMTYLTPAGPKKNGDESTGTFYERLKNHERVTTAALNAEELFAAAEPSLKAGRDVLYLAFSSGLSSSFQVAVKAFEDLSAAYPGRTVKVVDTLSESAGYGLLLALAAEKRKQGESLDEVARWTENTRLSVAHWFTVDDLQYLKRGGRISGAAAVIGGVLDIKPVLKMDDAGHLAPVYKVRGRKNAVKALGEQCVKNALAGSPVFIAHGDCADDARTLKETLEKACISVNKICEIGPVIGAHTGPGTLAIFFMAKSR